MRQWFGTLDATLLSDHRLLSHYRDHRESSRSFLISWEIDHSVAISTASILMFACTLFLLIPGDLYCIRKRPKRVINSRSLYVCVCFDYKNNIQQLDCLHVSHFSIPADYIN